MKDARKWILLVGGKPIAAIDSLDEPTKETKATLLAKYTETIFFEPVMLVWHLRVLSGFLKVVQCAGVSGNMLC